jgi:hypothetical protein
MTQPAYPAARAATARIGAHLARQLAASSPQQCGQHATAPDFAAIEAIIEAAFWASLGREEGYMPRISLAFVAPETVEWSLKFERRLPLAAQPLTRLAPAVERPGIHLGVWRDDQQFFVWGATRNLPAFCLVLEVIAPGLLGRGSWTDNQAKNSSSPRLLHTARNRGGNAIEHKRLELLPLVRLRNYNQIIHLGPP